MVGFQHGLLLPERLLPLEQQVTSAFREANYAGLLEITSTKVIAITREEPVAIWNPKTQQSESSTRVVHERLLVAGFTPLRKFKGDPSATELDTPADAAACGVTLKPGSRYLVYAYGPDDNGRISTNLCMRTAQAEDAAQEIEILNATTRPASMVSRKTGPERRFDEALDLLYARPDDADTMAHTVAIAGQLAQSDPFSGYSQALRAELLSMQLLANNGEPAERQGEVLALIDEALRINPKLVQVHVAKARTYASVSRLNDAQAELQTALRLQPQLPSAIFVQAEIYRRANNSAKAADWIRNYIAVVTQPVLKANGHQWYGNMYRDIAYHPEAVNREVNLLMARSALQMSIDLDPNNVDRLVNFVAFLNDLPADYAAAEKYATRALALEENVLARHHLAAARYQALQADGAALNAQGLREATARIEVATKVSLDEAVQFWGFREVIHVRLSRLQIRAARF